MSCSKSSGSVIPDFASMDAVLSRLLLWNGRFLNGKKGFPNLSLGLNYYSIASSQTLSRDTVPLNKNFPAIERLKWLLPFWILNSLLLKTFLLGTDRKKTFPTFSSRPVAVLSDSRERQTIFFWVFFMASDAKTNLTYISFLQGKES
jgi:hypothetical protein